MDTKYLSQFLCLCMDKLQTTQQMICLQFSKLKSFSTVLS